MTSTPVKVFAAALPSSTGHATVSDCCEGRIRQVLVCLDRSPFAEACLPHARSVVDAFGAKLTLLHVMASPEGDQPPTRLDAIDWEITRREAEQYLTRIRGEFEERGLPRARVSMDVTQGRPAERIVTFAREMGADLTVLGSHGEGGHGVCNLGSTAQQVLALAAGSVLVIPAESDPSWEVPAKRIMVAVDGSLRTQSVLPEVARLARFQGAQILLVHVVADPIPTAVLSEEEDLVLARTLATRLQASAEAYLSRLRERFFAEIAIVDTLVLRHANTRRALMEAASGRHADLLVLAAHGATGDAERAFGSVTGYAFSHGKLPLLVLQDLPSIERESSRPPAITKEAALNARASFGARSLEDI